MAEAEEQNEVTEKVSFPLPPIDEGEMLARCIANDDRVVSIGGGQECMPRTAFPEDELKGKKGKSVSVFRRDLMSDDCLQVRAEKIYKGVGGAGYAQASASAVRGIQNAGGVQQLSVTPSTENPGEPDVGCIFHADILSSPPPNEKLAWAELRFKLGQLFTNVVRYQKQSS